jgi:excisionase family DNA binding protein
MRDELHFVLRAARDLPAEDLPRLLGELEEIRCVAMARLTAPASVQSPGSDELLSIAEAARRLGVSKDFLYRHGSDFPFTRRMGRKLLFSSVGIEKHIKQQGVLTARRHDGTLLTTVKRTVKENR